MWFNGHLFGGAFCLWKQNATKVAFCLCRLWRMKRRGEERRRRRAGQTLPTNGNTFTIAVGNLRILNLLLAHGTLGPTCKWEGDNTWRRLGPSQLHSSTTLTSPSRWVPTYLLLLQLISFGFLRRFCDTVDGCFFFRSWEWDLVHVHGFLPCR